MEKYDILLLIIAVLSAIDILFIIMLFSARSFKHRRDRAYLESKKLLIDTVSGIGNLEDLPSLKIKPDRVFRIFKDISVSVVFSEAVSAMFLNYFMETGIADKYCRNIRSRNRYRRAEASINLGFLPGAKTHKSLEEALVKEKHFYIKVFIVNSLIDTEDTKAIPYILQTLIGSPAWYKEKIYGIIGQMGEKFNEFMKHIVSTESKELQMLIVSFSNYYSSPEIMDFLIGFMESDDPDVAVAAAESCKRLYPGIMCSENYMKSPHAGIRKAAVDAISSDPSPECLDLITDSMNDSSIYKDCVAALYKMVIRDNVLFQKTMERFRREKNPHIKNGIATVLSWRIGYLFSKLRLDGSDTFRNFIKDVISGGSLKPAIAFLNANSDPRLEDKICGIISEIIEEKPHIADEYRLYLDERILGRLGLARPEPLKAEPRRETVKKKLLIGFLASVVLVFPLIYVAINYEILGNLSLMEIFTGYFYQFNYFFAYYGISINLFFLLLLFFSFIGSRRQLKGWKMKNYKLFFKKGMLPSISIIAPAYAEETSIIESVNSLINLNYPDYEVIVVNDGSTDRTLEKLIGYFNLERDDIHVEEKLRTNTIRGLYRNRDIPNLLVVDKVNGGKADSLNSGINVASKDYFCGIDADSLLERESLLKMASAFLDSDRNIIASGGNILPVNGCTVDRGSLAKIKIPGGFLPRLQTVEYIRSFISGRVGWSTIRCLLIIGGAFGLFRKSSVIESGGYLTGREKYKKDTVGEDMELVVRLIKHSGDKGDKGLFNFIFNANCWTEVPESYTVLRRQRDRWQRGLLDTITFHIRMLFNLRYGTVGFIAFPYFILFEIIGPWIEAQGVIMFILSLSLGLLDGYIIFLVFIGIVFLGISISVMSFYIMERGNRFFSGKDITILLFYSFLENFGIRQFFSISRLGGYINVLRNKQGWGKMQRKGFQNRAGTA